MVASMEAHRYKDWDLRMKEVVRNLNNVLNRTTNKTPFQILHDSSPRFNDWIIRKLADESAEDGSILLRFKPLANRRYAAKDETVCDNH
ncbi:hypothetical protein CDAR_309611 [Caerostris darwini]|uniref:Uncharacterized protein n=1 Tax=Caerostris darwini TaxID=1538125 RepID=A0AAV4T987_9ARAC|nr:hypothetical protein CDAR_309611 [Caerostris darwini]